MRINVNMCIVYINVFSMFTCVPVMNSFEDKNWLSLSNFGIDIFGLVTGKSKDWVCFL